jgi:hypothetical protein
MCGTTAARSSYITPAKACIGRAVGGRVPDKEEGHTTHHPRQVPQVPLPVPFALDATIRLIW